MKTSFVPTKCPYCGQKVFHNKDKFDAAGHTICSICGREYSNGGEKRRSKGIFEKFCEIFDEDEPMRLEDELEEDSE